MSRFLAEMPGMTVTSFYGGDYRGRCIQLTLHPKDYTQLTKLQVLQLIDVFNRWLDAEKTFIKEYDGSMNEDVNKS